jgi:hypothetical protein
LVTIKKIPAEVTQKKKRKKSKPLNTKKKSNTKKDSKGLKGEQKNYKIYNC